MTNIGRHDPDYVVVGEGRAFNFEMIETAVRMIENGAKLVATNLDPNCPTQNGIRPGCGAIVAMLETATGRKAFSVGKPSPVMMRAARKELGLSADETTMIGDTMETDILVRRADGLPRGAGPLRQHAPRGSGGLRLPAGLRRRFGRRPVRLELLHGGHGRVSLSQRDTRGVPGRIGRLSRVPRPRLCVGVRTRLTFEDTPTPSRERGTKESLA